MGKNKKLLYVIIIAVAVIIPVMMEHNIIFKQSKYIYLLLCLIGIYTIVTSGLDIVFGYTGQISFGHAGFFCIGAYGTVLLTHPDWGLGKYLGITIPPIISIVIAIICNMEFEAILFFIVFILLRSYAGGVHLNTYTSCLICSCVSFWGILMIVKYIRIYDYVALVIISISLLVIKVISPVQDVNRPISPNELKIFNNKLNHSIGIIIILTFAFYFFELEKMLMMIAVTTLFMVCILFWGKLNYIRCVKNSRLIR